MYIFDVDVYMLSTTVALSTGPLLFSILYLV